MNFQILKMENFKLNGFEPEQLIWKHVDGIEIAHFHRELYQKHLNIKDIKHVTIVRDPLQRYLSLKTHNYPDSENWLRPQVDYVTEETNIWKFEDGFDETIPAELFEIFYFDLDGKITSMTQFARDF